jgi:hypothetical protein
MVIDWNLDKEIMKRDPALIAVLETSILFGHTLLISDAKLPENIHIPREYLKQILACKNRILDCVQLDMVEIFEAK